MSLDGLERAPVVADVMSDNWLPRHMEVEVFAPGPFDDLVVFPRLFDL